MATVLICATVDPSPALGQTFLGREGIRRLWLSQAADVLAATRREKPRLVLVDRDFPGAGALFEALARETADAPLTLAVLAPGAPSLVELDLVEAGAHAVLRLPAGATWEATLENVLPLTLRREHRFPVYFEVQARRGSSGAAGLAVVLDLAVGGAQVQCETEWTVGEAVELRFRLPASSRSVVASGSVIRRTGTRYGVEFQWLSGAAAEDLRALLVADPPNPTEAPTTDRA
jgi:PilZ domain-containing protein